MDRTKPYTKLMAIQMDTIHHPHAVEIEKNYKSLSQSHINEIKYEIRIFL